jgi:hypothetical protein
VRRFFVIPSYLEYKKGLRKKIQVGPILTEICSVLILFSLFSVFSTYTRSYFFKKIAKTYKLWIVDFPETPESSSKSMPALKFSFGSNFKVSFTQVPAYAIPFSTFLFCCNPGLTF